MRRALPLVLSLLLGVPGCGTYLGIAQFDMPLAFSGVRVHAECVADRHIRPFYFGLFLITFPDFVLSLAADLALLPVTGPVALVRDVHSPSPISLPPPPPAPPPPPPPPPPPTPEQLRALALRAKAEAAERARDADFRASERAFADALALARRVAPEDAVLHATLAHARATTIVHREEGLLALPSLSIFEIEARLSADPCDGVAWAARGVAWRESGELDRAEADLRLGAALCLIPSNAELVRAELRRLRAPR
jgi:hypothetical protein